MKQLLRTAACLLASMAAPASAFGWSHQQHILITRMAGARLIADATTPPALVAFLRANLSAGDLTPAAFERLAVTDVVGDDPNRVAHGLDRWVTVPDQVRRTLEGKVKIEPYGATEDAMHNFGAELFNGGDHQYRLNGKGKPDFLFDVPFDVHDPRYQRAGFLPIRTQECYDNLVTAIRAGDGAGQLKWAGYLAHYLEDSTQPQHATVDAKSVTFLAGQVPGVPAGAAEPANAGLAEGRLPKGINPHTDVEYTLFASAAEPLATYRRAYWKTLSQSLAMPRPPTIAAAHPVPPIDMDHRIFRMEREILSTSYDAIGLIGYGAAAGYKTGTFNPSAFYGYAGQLDDQYLTVAEMIADRNAAAVRQVEAVFRAAWAEAADGH